MNCPETILEWKSSDFSFVAQVGSTLCGRGTHQCEQ